MPRRSHDRAPNPYVGLPASDGAARAADAWGEGGGREDEEIGVRSDVVLGELRPPNEVMAQMIRTKLGRLLQDR